MKMRFLCIFAFVATLCLASGAPENETAALIGKWRAVEASSNGEPPPNGMLDKLVLVFAADTVSIMGAPPTRFKVDTSFKPSHIDILNSKNQVGIYVLDGDTLKLCFGQEGDRPKEFLTKKNSDHTYLLLKHIKE